MLDHRPPASRAAAGHHRQHRDRCTFRNSLPREVFSSGSFATNVLTSGVRVPI